MYRFNRIIVIVFDSMGIGAAPDAVLFHDEGANTLLHVCQRKGRMDVPTLHKMGLGNVEALPGIPPVERPIAYFGKMREVSAGKDTTSGHWEIAGLKTSVPFDTFPNGFPGELIEPLERRLGKPVLGNKPASGTAIIDELGAEHMLCGSPIVYTSADSVYQIAAHEEVIPLKELYSHCEFVRSLLNKSSYQVGRVIARPFEGKTGEFRRTLNRKDFSLIPPSPTILNRLSAIGIQTVGVGKIGNIFNGFGIDRDLHTTSDREGIAVTRSLLQQSLTPQFIFINLIQLDMDFGHRKEPIAYGSHIESLDPELGRLLQDLSDSDLLILTADHGTDPVTPGTDHTREYVPLLVYHRHVSQGRSLGTRSTFADIAQTVAENFEIPRQELDVGTSFLGDIIS